MGSFYGHVIPGLLVLLYGLTILVNHLHRSILLSFPNADTQRTLASSMQSDTLRSLGYLLCIIWASIHSVVELIQWDGDYTSMSSLQHATTQFLIVLAAVTGLLIDNGMVSRYSRWLLSVVFVLSGLMILSHSSPDAYESAIHHVQSYALILSGFSAGFYGIFVIVVDDWLDNPGKPLSSVVLGFYHALARLTSLLVILSGTWFLQIAFSEWDWYSGDHIKHAPVEAHLQTLIVSWHILGIFLGATIIEVWMRYSAGLWPISIYDISVPSEPVIKRRSRNSDRKFDAEKGFQSYADTSPDSSRDSSPHKGDSNI